MLLHCIRFPDTYRHYTYKVMPPLWDSMDEFRCGRWWVAGGMPGALQRRGSGGARRGAGGSGLPRPRCRCCCLRGPPRGGLLLPQGVPADGCVAAATPAAVSPLTLFDMCWIRTPSCTIRCRFRFVEVHGHVGHSAVQECGGQQMCAYSLPAVPKPRHASEVLRSYTGDGHFSPIGGYHAGRDLALILDTARFKVRWSTAAPRVPPCLSCRGPRQSSFQVVLVWAVGSSEHVTRQGRQLEIEQQLGRREL